jgi:hypothetical protein
MGIPMAKEKADPEPTATSGETSTVDELISKFKDKSFVDLLKKNPDALREITDSVERQAAADETQSFVKFDTQMYRMAIAALGGVAILVVLTYAVLAGMAVAKTGQLPDSIKLPDGLVALASAAIGALAGMLTPLSGRK